MRPQSIIKLLTHAIPNRRRILIKGAPGIGKTQVVQQVIAALGKKYILVMMHPAVSDPTDFKGLPAIVDGKGVFLPLGQLRKMIEEKTRQVVCFIDDIGQAPPAVQAAIMQLIWGGELEGHDLSHVTFVGATNDNTHMAGVQQILEPVKSRWSTIVSMEVHVPDWITWAWAHNMPPQLIAYTQFRPENLSAFKATKDLVNSPSPRTVAEVGEWVNTADQEPGLFTSGELLEIIAGAVGEGYAAEFTGFARTYQSLPDIDEALRDPLNAQTPMQGDDASIYFACSAAIAHRVDSANFGNGMKYIERLGAEWGLMMVRDATKRDRELINTQAYMDWHTRHAAILEDDE